MTLRIGPMLVVAATLITASCGLTVPEMNVLGRGKETEKLDENVIVNQIKCELHKGVQDVLSNPPVEGNSVDWLKKWGAKVTLTITVDEKGGVAPGATLNTIHPSAITKFANGNVTTSQTYSLAFGFSGSADATRKEAIAFTYAFADLLNEKPIIGNCDNEAGILIHSDLKIGEFIANKAFIASIPGSAGGGREHPTQRSTMKSHSSLRSAAISRRPGSCCASPAVDRETTHSSAQRAQKLKT